MRFTESELLPGQYRWAFLDWIDRIAPEVMADLKALTPKYKAVFGENSNWRTARQLSWLFIESDTEDVCQKRTIAGNNISLSTR